ncbi:hypothetical protein TNCV_609971 [Trichonephila clavipes]|nr:hypothetical protein TNCV_609971 [Trichonephila clavipes]
MMHRSSPVVVVLGWPPPIFLTAVPVVWNAFKARETTILLIPNFAATLVTIRPAPPPAFRLFFHDTVPVRTSRCVETFQHAHDDEVVHLTWCLLSSELNIVECFWRFLGKKIRAWFPLLRRLSDLKTALHEE